MIFISKWDEAVVNAERLFTQANEKILEELEMAEEFVNEQNVTEVIEKNEASYEEVKVSSEETDTDDYYDEFEAEEDFSDDEELKKDAAYILDDLIDSIDDTWDITNIVGCINEIRTNIRSIQGILLHHLELQNNEKMVQFVDAFGRELSSSIKGIKNAIAVYDTTNTAFSAINKGWGWN